MKDFDLRELFCEVLSGLFVLLLVVPLLHFAGVSSLDKTISVLLAKFSLSLATSLSVLCYLLGLLFDAVGFAFSEGSLGNCIETETTPSDNEVAHFWKSVEEHVLDYRERQWRFFSCYRNVFLLAPLCGIAWGVLLWERHSWVWLVVILLATIALEVALFISMRGLLDLYYRITKYVGTP